MHDDRLGERLVRPLLGRVGADESKLLCLLSGADIDVARTLKGVDVLIEAISLLAREGNRKP